MKAFEKREKEICDKRKIIIDKWKSLKEKFIDQQDLFRWEKVV